MVNKCLLLNIIKATTTDSTLERLTWVALIRKGTCVLSHSTPDTY